MYYRSAHSTAILSPIFGIIDTVPNDVIVSPDTLRLYRIAPGQSQIVKWPDPDHSSWTLSRHGLVNQNLTLSPTQLAALPRIKVHADFHCVTRHGLDGSWTTNLALAEFLAEVAFVAPSLEHGAPARLIVPPLYARKSAKRLRTLEFFSANRAGLWERNGYHRHGDSCQEHRFVS